MSYDIALRSLPCTKCHRRGEEPYLPDPTYNLTPIFDLALTGGPLPNADTSEAAVVLHRAQTDRPRGLRILSGRKGGDTVAMLDAAVARLEDPAQEAAFLALEPDNGWGTLDGARKVMGKLLIAARTYPENVWEVG